jgi:hypothetical protein
MFTVTIENRIGDVVELTHNRNYIVERIDGLAPPKSKINYSEIAGMSGGLFNSSKTEVRNLVLYIRPQFPVEENRLKIYRMFQTGQWCKIYYKNNSLDVEIEGYVEIIESDLFQLGQVVQVSIICPQPFFEGVNEIYTSISSIISGFEFPIAIAEEGIEFSTIHTAQDVNVFNEGDVETGVIVEIVARGEVINPIIYSDKGGSIMINVTMQEFDKIAIDTRSGQRSVKLLRDSVETNLLNNLGMNPEWFTLRPADNVFSYDAEIGVDFLDIVFKHKTKFGGV